MEQFSKVKEDIINPRTGVVSDEYVDFILWTRGLKSRQEYFAEYIEKCYRSSNIEDFWKLDVAEMQDWRKCFLPKDIK